MNDKEPVFTFSEWWIQNQKFWDEFSRACYKRALTMSEEAFKAGQEAQKLKDSIDRAQG